MALDNFRTQKIIWDRANKKIFEAIEANSGDSNGRKLVVQVINQEATESLSGTTLSLGWKSRNGAKGLDAFKVVDASKGIFEIYYTSEMLSNIGNIEASLILIDSTSRIESSAFTISVRPSTVDDESVESENSFTALTEALVKVNDIDAQLAHKVGGGKKAELEDLSGTVLSAIEGGEGTIFNLLSIPQDKSVTPIKTDFISVSPSNLFNPDEAEDGYRLGRSGLVTVNAEHSLSEFISVKANVSYIIKLPATIGRVGLYDIDKKYVSILVEGHVTSGVEVEFTPPVDGYVRFSVSPISDKYETTMAKVSDYEGVVPFKYKLSRKIFSLPDINSVDDKSVINKSIPYFKTDFVATGKNKYNKLTDSIDIYISMNAITEYIGYRTSDFIRIEKGKTYTINRMRFINFYSELKGFIDGVTHDHTPYTFTADYDGFIRFSYHDDNSLVQMEEGTENTAVEPFGYKFLGADANLNELSINPLYGKKVLFNGDSITRASHYPNSGWPRLIGTNNSMDWVNVGADGKTIAKTDDIRGSVVNDIQTMSDIADYIILQGGVNDLGLGVPLGQITSGFNDVYDEYTFAGAFESMLRQSILKWKGKKIGFIVTFKATNNYQQYEPYFEIARNACEKWSVPYLDLYKASGLTAQLDEIATLYFKDGDRKHPNEKGYEVITPKIEAWLRTL